MEKIDGCKNNNKSKTRYCFGLFKIYNIVIFKSIENIHDVYRDKDCMKKFYESLREQAMKIINFEFEKK